MIDTLEILEELKETFEPPQAERLARLLARLYKDIANTVTKEEFKELTEVVKKLSERIDRLAEAQEKTEERINALAEAQRRTEERVNELAEAQRRTEESLESFKRTTEENFNRVWKAIDELAEAQRRTEESLESFKRTTEENFNRVWKAIDELAEAQRRTEESLNRLIKRVDIIEERLEGVSNSVGYSLENSAYKALPLLLKKEGVEVSGRLIRRYWQENQINIWGKGRQRGKEILILGEAKVRPSKKEIDRFIKIAEEIKRKEKKDAFLLFVAHDFPPAIEEYLKHKGIRYYWSYEFVG